MLKRTLVSLTVLCASIAAPIMADTSAQLDTVLNAKSSSCSDELWFSLDSYLYNYSGRTVEGTIYCNVFNPEGKHTFLGSTRFSVNNGNTIPIFFDEVRGNDSDDFGLYSMVLGIVFDPSDDDVFSFDMSGYQYIRKDEERRAVSFDYYTEQEIELRTYQATIPFYHHKHVWN